MIDSNFSEKLSEGFFRLLGFDERRRYISSRIGLVDGASVVDLGEEFNRARSEFWHRMRVAAIIFFGPTALWSMALVLGYEIAPIFKLILVSLVVASPVFANRAINLYFKKSDFTKSPQGSEIYEFIDQFGGAKTLRTWADEFPAASQFIDANKMFNSYSVFEFELVQAYVWQKLEARLIK